jgi:D-glycero-D-manno-heptose 1,7-bisphosphate phosphatase
MKSNSWTLFLDRDGVINRRLPGAYVRSPGAFEFLPGVLEALPVLGRYFSTIIVLTNQQGIGKGWMTEQDLGAVHAFMRRKIAAAGGRIDGLYYCPHLASAGCSCRKPRPGLALQARRDFPEIDFRYSVLVGDSASDIELAGKLGMASVWVRHPEDDRSMPLEPGLILGGLSELLPHLAQWKITSVAPKP